MPKPRRSAPKPDAGSNQFWHPKIEIWPVGKLKPSQPNARTHPRKQRDKLLAVVRQCGFINPILIDHRGVIISGNLRKQVAEELGLDQVPVIQITHLTDAEKRALALAENRIALDAGWDRETLAAELGELAVLLPEAEIDLSITGFDVAETDLIIGDHSEAPEDPVTEQLPQLTHAVSRPGDLWLLDKHRLYCGDARDAGAYKRLMGREQATMIFTDPPYNISLGVQARPGSRIAFDEFAMASGEMSDRQFQRFLERVMEAAAGACVDGTIAYWCIDWRHVRQLLDAGDVVFSELKNIVCWVKPNGGQGTFYRNQHELIAIFKKGRAPHVNSFELGQWGRTRTNVWSYAGVNAFKSGRQEELDSHPTIKPTRLVADAMLDCSRRGAIVLDPFMGSGTTILAGQNVGRRAYGMEIDPRYVDVAVRRWQKLTGRDAILESTRATFTETEQQPREGLDEKQARPKNAKTCRRGR